MYSKHDELEKEMDFQMHLHEPRRIRIETDIHNVRAGKNRRRNRMKDVSIEMLFGLSENSLVFHPVIKVDFLL